MDLLEYIMLNKDIKLPMHMPGHKRNVTLAPYLSKLAADCDMTEIDGFDNLHGAQGILREGMDRTAALWGSRKAFWLVNGSTCGILAGIWAACPDGAAVIVSRNCHVSVYNGLRLRRARPIFLMPDMDAKTGIFGVLRPEDVSAALEQYPDTRLIILTSPTYEGVVSDIKTICSLAHAKGVPVLVDEAHGAHLGFGSGFPESALHNGADIVIHSLHKTLPSLTQTAVLHLNGNLVNENRVASALSIFETSSPSYLLMASISGCTTLLEKHSNELMRAWHENLQRAYWTLNDLQNLYLYDAVYMRDPSKIVICTNKSTVTGGELADTLRGDFHIEVEMASAYHIIAMTGIGDTRESLDALRAALLSIDTHIQPRVCALFPEPILPACALSSWDVEQKIHTFIELSQAIGRVCAETVWAYPPGIPLIIPGEVFAPHMTELILGYQRQGVRLNSSSGCLPEQILVLSD